MAKVKLALRALDDVLDGMPEHITKLVASSGLKVTELELAFTGSVNIDRDGGVDIGGEASANAVEIAAGVPLTVKAGFASKWDNQGAVTWTLRAKFG